MNHHLMIDLETLGLRESSMILQVGCCLFNLNEIYDTLKMDIDIELYDDRFSVDAATIRWWMKAREDCPINGSLHPSHIPSRINNFIGGRNVYLWSKSTIIDVSILKYYYRVYGFEWLFDFRKIHEVRTLEFFDAGEGIDYGGQKHDALNDAIKQSEYVIGVLNEEKYK